ncbi:MAG: hypothetical protein QF842_00175 [Candidatus Marinimicrobia bacterium]|jgi:hypothetical protein|nr:hypothetical protein [Candidatus Neomarinimicrobiota bacterium]MDP6611369.1 hypothetical protein [Candidatus Neomarinimicrobiota bacterium]|tara:strand:- start:14269 stop:14481 length:213 start_codon:yes stop_codon:yes gene_type:complete
MDFAQTWLPFLYLYGVGGIAFVLGMILILRTKALRVSFDRHKKWVFVLLYGFIFYAGIHAFFIYLAIGSQ